MSNTDFVSWDDEDLNLDLLLGEYTDYDEHCNSESVRDNTQLCMSARMQQVN